MCVENPLLAFIDLVNKLRAGDVLTEDLKQPFSQVGINFISDSYRTALCLEFPPQKIAAACAFLTVVFLRALPDDRPRTAALYGGDEIKERAETLLSPADNYGGRRSFRYISTLAIALTALFGLLFIRDRIRGGYKAEKIGGEQ